MKRLFIVLLLLSLCSCKEKPITWEDVKASYDEIVISNKDYVKGKNTYLKNDYLNLINDIKNNFTSLTNEIDKDNQEIPIKIYTDAIQLESIVNTVSIKSDELDVIKKFVVDTKNLVKAAYDKTEDFDQLKSNIEKTITQIDSWNQTDWLALEIKEYYKWDDVKEEFETLYQETKDNLKRRRNVTEAELEELKDTIIDSYEKVIYGIDKSNEKVAQDIYAAAVSLKEYTEGLKNKSALKVNKFATQAIEYIEKTLGNEIEDPEYDFLNEVESAKKWTLNLFNEVTTEMKRN